MDVNLAKDLPMTSIPQVEELAHAYCCRLFGEQEYTINVRKVAFNAKNGQNRLRLRPCSGPR